MTLPTVPPPPTPPGDGATDAQKQAFAYAFHNYKAESERMQAMAHIQMAAAISRAADVQAMTNKRDLVLHFAKEMPQRSTDTPNSYFDAVATMVDQFLKEHGAP